MEDKELLDKITDLKIVVEEIKGNCLTLKQYDKKIKLHDETMKTFIRYFDIYDKLMEEIFQRLDKLEGKVRTENDVMVS